MLGCGVIVMIGRLEVIVAILSLQFLLVGCSTYSNGTVTRSSENLDVNYIVTGIPLLIGAYGSSVPISANVSITAGHVARYSYYKVIAYHPTCDIALLKADNSDKVVPKFGHIFRGQYILNLGKNALGENIQSEGKYLIDFHFDNFHNGCFTSVSTAALQLGMSGGGAYNSKHQLVGVNFAIIQHIDVEDEVYSLVNNEERRSAFVALPFISDWIRQETGIALY